MNYEVAALWASVVFGGLGALLLIIWFATGRKSAALQIAGAVSVLISLGAGAYTNYIA
jgi:hypothetical protein